MQPLNSQHLLQTLEEETRQLQAFAHQLPVEQPNVLLQCSARGGWSVAQILEHLNTYCNYYLPLITSALARSPQSTSSVFRPGWLGDYFTKLIQPTPDGVTQKKMKAAKQHLPAPQPNATVAVQAFVSHQQQLQKLLQQAAGKNLQVIKIPVSIAPIIKLKTGDVLRFLCAHQQRHLKQMKLVLAEVHQPSITYS